MKSIERISLGIFSLLFLPFSTLAADEKGSNCGYDGTSLTQCGTNGLSSVTDIIIRVTNWVLGISGAVAVLFIIYGGILYITSAGNEKQADSAKKTLTVAIIGVIVILLSKVIITLVANTINGVSTTTITTKP